MMSKEEFEESMGKLTSPEIIRFRYVRDQIEHLLDHPDITEDSLQLMNNLAEEMRELREIFIERLLHQYKRGNLP